MVGVKTGALNFPKMLRHLQHRTNQVKDLTFLRRPLTRPSTAATKDSNKDGTRNERFYGPPVDFGYTESQAVMATIPDYATDKTFFETTWGLQFQNLKGLQNPKITLDNNPTAVSSRARGTADFFVPSYDVLKQERGFGGHSHDDGTPAALLIGASTESCNYGFTGSFTYAGWATTTITDSITSFDIVHYSFSEKDRGKHAETHEGIATEIKVGDVILLDSPESRANTGDALEGNMVGDISKGRENYIDIMPAKHYTGGSLEGTYTRVPDDGATMTLIDATGVSKTFEFDYANNGVTSGRIAVVPTAQNCIEYAYALVTAINASDLQITALNHDPRLTSPLAPHCHNIGYVSGGNTIKRTSTVYLQQDRPGAWGGTTITYDSNNTARHFQTNGNYSVSIAGVTYTNANRTSSSDTTTKTNLFINDSPEHMLVTGVTHGSHSGSSSVGGGGPAHSNSQKSTVTVVRGWDGSYIHEHSKGFIDDDTQPWTGWRDAGKVYALENRSHSNHSPLVYIIKKGHAYAKITFTGQSDANGTIAITSTDGTTKTYTAKTSPTLANNEFNRGGTATDAATSLQAALNETNGHRHKINVHRVGAVLYLQQATSGTAGNTTITENLTGAAITTNFTGGAADSNVLENGTTLTLNDADGNSHTFTTDNTLTEYESTSTKIGTKLTVQNPSKWTEAFTLAFYKACRTNHDYKIGAGSVPSTATFPDYPIPGSETTPKLNINHIATLASNYYIYGSGLKADSTTWKWGFYEDYEVGPMQYGGPYTSTNGKDFVANWENTDHQDATGQAWDIFSYTSLQAVTNLVQITSGKEGNTEVTGTSSYSAVGHWWNGMLSGNPAEQYNRRFHGGTSFKGKFIQTRLDNYHSNERTQNNLGGYTTVDPYFYEFLSGDLLYETDKETYRFAVVDNVSPVIGARDARFDTGGSPLSEIGVAFPQGTHVAGVEADRIKFKIKLTSGQADLRNEYYSTFTGASGFREWNRFRGRGRRDADFADIYDYSVNFHGFRFYFTQNNVIYRRTFRFGADQDDDDDVLNLKVGRWYEFDLPLTRPDINYIFGNNFQEVDDTTNEGIYSGFSYGGTQSVNYEGHSNFFPLWVDGQHFVCNTFLDSPTNGQENFRELRDTHLAYDVSDGNTYMFSKDGEKLGGPINIRRCRGYLGDHLGRMQQTVPAARNAYDDSSIGTSSYASYMPKGGLPDFCIYNEDGIDQAVRASFKDVVVYKPKKWRVKTVQEYDSEYIKLSCERIGNDENPVRRRAYGK